MRSRLFAEGVWVKGRYIWLDALLDLSATLGLFRISVLAVIRPVMLVVRVALNRRRLRVLMTSPGVMYQGAALPNVMAQLYNIPQFPPHGSSFDSRVDPEQET